MSRKDLRARCLICRCDRQATSSYCPGCRRVMDVICRINVVCLAKMTPAQRAEREQRVLEHRERIEREMPPHRKYQPEEA